MPKERALRTSFSIYSGLPREIYIIFFARIINNIGSFVQPILVLILTQKTGMGSDEAGLFVTIQALLCAPGIIIAGKLADTIGRKRIILISQGAGAIALIICGLMKPTLEMTYLLIASSVFYSMSQPAYDALVADITTPENRKASYSLTYMGMNLGFAIGPILGGLLFENALPLVFIGDGLTTIMALLLVMVFIPETMGKDPVREIDEDRVLEQKVEGSVFHLLFRRRILLSFALISFFYFFIFSQWNFTLPMQMADIFDGKGAALYGTLASFNGLVVLVVTPALTKMTRNFHPISLISSGGLCYGLSFVIFGFIHVLPAFYIGVFIMTLGEILVSVNSRSFIADYTPASHRGRVSSILPIITGAGYTLGPVITGKVISTLSFTAAWIITACIGFVSAAMMQLLKRKTRLKA
jgi:MFS family permease